MNTEAIYNPAHQRTRSLRSAKIRDSCDFCSLSKVKCDRGQPQCLRCIRSGVTCHYSESRRFGRARQIYAAHSSTTRPIAKAVGRQAQSMPWQDAYNNSDIPYTKPGTTPHTQPAIHHSSADYVPSLEVSGSPYFQMSDPVSNVSNVPGHSPDHLSKGAESETTSISGSVPPDLGNAGLTNIVMQKTLLSDSATLRQSTMQREGTDCMKHALSALQELHALDGSCVRLSGLPTCPRCTLDAAVRNNRLAIKKVVDVLNCPCAQDMSIMLLLVLITHRVMKSYHTLMAQGLDLFPCAEAPCSSSPVSSVTLFAIGNDGIDGKLQTRLILQLLWCEVYQTEPLLCCFNQYVGSMHSRPENLILRSYIDLLRVHRQDIMRFAEMEIDGYATSDAAVSI
ncbi:hypothetical protein BBP40_010008 [Aspergillus hancockii]|nr:hypothetical protein BBP40_010008 [Aspergillus hancockii]